MQALSKNEIHVWQIDLQSNTLAIDSAYQTLDNSEKNRADRFKFPHHRKSFIQSHAAVRILLQKYTDIKAENIQMHVARNGKPYLEAMPQLHFNLSHSENIALFAITENTSVGIDIEYQKTNQSFLQVAKRYFSESEYEHLLSLEGSKQLERFYQLWTCKEAILKALGDGLRFPLNAFSLLFSAAGGAEIINAVDERLSQNDWQIISYSPLKNYQAAVAAKRKINVVRCFNY